MIDCSIETIEFELTEKNQHTSKKSMIQVCKK